MALGPDMPEEPPQRSAKSAAAFRTISEVAEELDVPQHVLRFWETKFTQIKPLKRAGGRRYYRPADLDLLRKVSKLLYHEGYTIKGVQRLLREREGKAVAATAPTALPFSFIEEPKPIVEMAPPVVKSLDADRERDLTAPPVVAKRLDRVSRSTLETVLAELLDLRALLKPVKE